MKKTGFGLCDLHTHSIHSDGTCSPEELLRRAEELGLSALALCDHNTLGGLPDFLRAGKASPVEAVAGVEITAEYDSREIHILGLFVPEAAFPAVNVFLEEIRKEKEAANEWLYRNLTQAGYRLSFERILGDGEGTISRVQFARELVRCGYLAGVCEAFAGILKENGGFYQPPKRKGGLEVIRFLRSVSAVPVLAHPFLNLNLSQLGAFLPMAKEAGLLAMETRYSLFDDQTTRLAQTLAEEFGLLPSGGSDFHGTNKPDISLGTGRGGLRVPAEYYEALKSVSRL